MYKSKAPDEINAGNTSFFQYVVKIGRDIKISTNCIQDYFPVVTDFIYLAFF